MDWTVDALRMLPVSPYSNDDSASLLCPFLVGSSYLLPVMMESLPGRCQTAEGVYYACKPASLFSTTQPIGCATSMEIGRYISHGLFHGLYLHI